MRYGMTGGKRQREANRERKKKTKADRLARNRSAPRTSDEVPLEDMVAAAEPEVKLEDINISGVAPRGPKGSNGPRKLFVGGLSWDTDGAQLRTAFSRFGTVVEASVVKDRDTGKSRGFGFVTFANAIDAATASKAMNGADMDGRQLKVNPADER